jgi:hypothetical protein
VCAGDGVGGATAELALVVNGRALRAQIDLGRKCGGDFHRRSVSKVAMIGQIANPTVTFDFVVHGRGELLAWAIRKIQKTIICKTKSASKFFSWQLAIGRRETLSLIDGLS